MMFKNKNNVSGKKRLSEQVIETVKQKISSGELNAGDRLPNEAELMVMFGVGRSTIRESMKILSGEGYLTVLQGKGTFVQAASRENESLRSRLNRANILEVYEMRRILELEIVKLAALRRTQEDLLVMRKALENRKVAKEENNTAAYIENDVIFHTAIAAACKNGVAFDLYKSFSGVLRDALQSFVNDQELYKNQISIHEKILAAIAERDPEAAVYWTAQNLDATTQDLIELLK